MCFSSGKMSKTDLTSICNLLCGWILRYRCAHLLKPAWHTVGLYGPRHLLSASVKDVFNINYLLHKDAPSTSLAPNFTAGQAELQEVTPGHVLQRELLSRHASNLHCHRTNRVMMCAENNYLGPRQRRWLLVSECPNLLFTGAFLPYLRHDAGARENNLHLIGCYIVCSTDP